MKKAVYIFLFVAAGAALSCGAGYVTVPQASAADYIFTVPALTNNIQGKVIDPAAPYGAIRSEDVDWIHEALAERVALQGGAVAAHPAPGTGPEVELSGASIAPIGWVDSPAAWLDAGAPLLEGVRLWDGGGGPDVTNVWERAAYTNGMTNAISTIEMPLTNGTVSVWTNSWRTEVFLPCVETVTNVHAWTVLDTVHGVEGVPFPAYTNTPRVAWGEMGIGVAYHRRLPSAKSFAHAYAVLRGTKRLADVEAGPTNAGPYVVEGAYKNGPHTFTTNGTASAGGTYELFCGCTTNGYWSNLARWTPAADVLVPTRFASDVVTTGGASRVTVEAMYAYGRVAYYYRDHGTYLVDVSTNATVRLAGPSLDLGGAQAVARAYVDPAALCSVVATRCGMQPVPGTGVEYVPGSGEDLHWSFSIDRYVIVYSISPTVKLPDW